MKRLPTRRSARIVILPAVAFSLALTLIGCGGRPGPGPGEECVSGVTRCNGDAVETCVSGQFGAPVACGMGESCSLGACTDAASCVDDCLAAAATVCSGSSVLTCGEYDSDTCLDLGAAVDCMTGQSCSNGVCGMSCMDECTSGTDECVGVGASRSCGDFDEDDCLDWSAPAACNPGESCNVTTGLCEVAQCMDECDPMTYSWTCASPGFTACVTDGDNDPCFEEATRACDVCADPPAPIQCSECCG